MAIKDYFCGRSGKIFWGNVCAAIIVLVTVPFVALIWLDEYTNHGEKIEVPDVTGLTAYEAQAQLEAAMLEGVVADSAYNPKRAAGAVLKQIPAAGQEVKSGRLVYLTVNLGGQPMVSFPDLAGNSSLREAQAKLRAMGFDLDSVKRVDGQPRDLVLAIHQGLRELHAGDMVSRDRKLVIVAGAGESDSLEIDTTYYTEETAADFDF